MFWISFNIAVVACSIWTTSTHNGLLNKQWLHCWKWQFLIAYIGFKLLYWNANWNWIMYVCYPLDLCYSKCRFSTDRIKQRSNVYCLLSLFIIYFCFFNNKKSLNLTNDYQKLQKLKKKYFYHLRWMLGWIRNNNQLSTLSIFTTPNFIFSRSINKTTHAMVDLKRHRLQEPDFEHRDCSRIRETTSPELRSLTFFRCSLST